MLLPNPDTFRTNALTVIGSTGYLVAFGIAVIETMHGDPVPVKLVTVLIIGSGSALGLDFGFDFLPFQPKSREDNTKDTENTDGDNKRGAG